ncbi:hypothetical protein [Tautonia plasticadhaerens]|uniref:Uncharacterized protein n=1 Tax=Tautonia plasticadhaerens TaxID=2527974 RepID=A0A518GY10_9BACT|nr:hypothetical protein [Tautonia plasticadhaerens]QDV33477.1 hypothetical protein ElP_13500 [Tautonia plasticadhaerens]
MARIAAATVWLTMVLGCASPGRGLPLADRVVPCPCKVEGLARLPEQHTRLVVTLDRDRSTSRFHPGAFVTYRLFDPETDPVAGNQCAYDRGGRLISAGPAAGTPDLVSPERSVIGHWLLDVRPFRRLGWMEYHRRGWAPVSRSDCL